MSRIRLNAKLQNVAFLGKKAFITRATTYSLIDGDAVLELAAMNSGINQGQLAAAMYAILQSFKNFLLNGHSVELPGVGIFRAAVNAYMVDNKEEVDAKNVYRRKVLYTPSVKLKNELNSASLTLDDGEGGGGGDKDKEYTITVQPNNSAAGTTTGSGEYKKGEEVTISAEAKEGYVFQCWDDYDSNAERTITVEGNKVYTAIFVEE